MRGPTQKFRDSSPPTLPVYLCLLKAIPMPCRSRRESAFSKLLTRRHFYLLQQSDCRAQQPDPFSITSLPIRGGWIWITTSTMIFLAILIPVLLFGCGTLWWLTQRQRSGHNHDSDSSLTLQADEAAEKDIRRRLEGWLEDRDDLGEVLNNALCLEHKLELMRSQRNPLAHVSKLGLLVPKVSPEKKKYDSFENSQ